MADQEAETTEAPGAKFIAFLLFEIYLENKDELLPISPDLQWQDAFKSLSALPDIKEKVHAKIAEYARSMLKLSALFS